MDTRDEVFETAMNLLEKEIAVIHPKDFKAETGVTSCMAAGLGDMDYRSILRFAKEKKPFIHATLENTRPENAQQALEYLRQLEASL